MSGENEFGSEFGVGTPVVKRRSARGRLWRLVFFGLVLSLLGYLLPKGIHLWREFYQKFAERNPPTIEFVKPPYGFGTVATELRIRLSDIDSGLDEVKVRYEQGSARKDLVVKKFLAAEKDYLLLVPLAAKELGLRAGDVRISVTLFDRSFWSNSARVNAQFKVDYETPKVEVLSAQHNAVRGGVQLVFYRYSKEPHAFSGVIVGSDLFPGFPASELDSAFSGFDLHFAYFAIPLDFQNQPGKVRVFVRDAVGNMGTAGMYYTITETKSTLRKAEVSREFAEVRIENLYRQALQNAQKYGASMASAYTPASSLQEMSARFNELQNIYHPAVERSAKPLFARPTQKARWEEPFLRQAGSSKWFAFGDRKKLVISDSNTEELVLGEQRVEATEYNMAFGAVVRAANAGKVIFVGEFGLFGQTVVLDHGFGLTTLYYHLDSLSVKEGDEISAGETIGRAGNSGLIDRVGVGYQVRLHGIPVRPEEWWDKNWLRAHVFEKIASMKKLLGISVAVPVGQKQ